MLDECAGLESHHVIASKDLAVETDRVQSSFRPELQSERFSVDCFFEPKGWRTCPYKKRSQHSKTHP